LFYVGMGGDLLFYTWGLGFSFVADGRRVLFNVYGRHFLLYLGGTFVVFDRVAGGLSFAAGTFFRGGDTSIVFNLSLYLIFSFVWDGGGKAKGKGIPGHWNINLARRKRLHVRINASRYGGRAGGAVRSRCSSSGVGFIKHTTSLVVFLNIKFWVVKVTQAAMVE
jgi:hypothetical protein